VSEREAPSRRPWHLWVLTILAVVSAAIASIDVASPDGGTALERRLFPRFDRQEVVAIHWGQGDDALVLERRGDALAITVPRSGTVRPAALDAFFGAIEVLRPMRVLDGESTTRMRTVDIDLGSRHLRFAVSVGDRAGQLDYAGSRYAIPRYLAEELDLHADDVRATRPFAAVGEDDASGFMIGGDAESTIVEGPPWLILYSDPKGRLFADPEVVQEIGRLLRGISYQGFVADDPDAPPRAYVKARVGVDWIEMVVIGSCDEGRYKVTSAIGTGCVLASAVDAIRRLGLDGKRVLDRHLVVPGRQGEVASVRITRDERALELRGGDGWRVNGAEVEPIQVLSWLRRFDDLISGEPIAVPDAGLATRAVVTLELTDGSTVELRFVSWRGSVWVRRADEPALWPVSREVDEVVRADPSAFAGLELIEHASTELTRAVARRHGVVVHEVVRGVLLSDWSTPSPGRRVDATAVSSLAHAVGYLHAERHLGAGELGDDATELELHFEDPLYRVEQVARMRVTRGDAGCIAVLEGTKERFLLGASDCNGLLGTWTR